MKITLLVVFVASLATAQSAVTIGQVDTFQGSSLHDWARGNFASQPLNVTTGGPAGSGDAFIRILSDGAGSNGKMLIYNNSQWAGDFTGVTSIAVDMINLGSVSLVMRLSFRDTASMGDRGYVTNDSLNLLPGSGWQSVVFDLSDLAAVDTGTPQATYMSQIAQMRILHAPSPTSVIGSDVSAILGVDNVTAVPEASISLLAVIGTMLAVSRRKR